MHEFIKQFSNYFVLMNLFPVMLVMIVFDPIMCLELKSVRDLDLVLIRAMNFDL